MTYILKNGDRYPALTAVLSDQSGVINLSTASKVKFIMKTGATTVEGECSVVGATEGKVEYPWGSSDTTTNGTYEAEFKIEWAGGKIESVPSAEYDSIQILPSL